MRDYKELGIYTFLGSLMVCAVILLFVSIVKLVRTTTINNKIAQTQIIVPIEVTKQLIGKFSVVKSDSYIDPYTHFYFIAADKTVIRIKDPVEWELTDVTNTTITSSEWIRYE